MNNLDKQVYKHTQNSDTIVIFIHGFTESPRQFIYLANCAYKNGYSYANLLLPGHGKTSTDFYKNGYKNWVTYVNNQVDFYRKKYKNIFLVGHSMGCLLSINTYLYYNKNIKGIFCINIPFNIRVNVKTFLSVLNIVFAPNHLTTKFVKNMENNIGIYNRKIYQYIFWLPRFLDLFYLSYKIYFNIKNINIPIVFLQSYKDGLVSIKSAVKIKKLLKKYNKKQSTIIVLKKSGHFYYSKEDKNIIKKSFLSFIKKYNI